MNTWNTIDRQIRRFLTSGVVFGSLYYYARSKIIETNVDATTIEYAESFISSRWLINSFVTQFQYLTFQHWKRPALRMPQFDHT